MLQGSEHAGAGESQSLPIPLTSPFGLLYCLADKQFPRSDPPHGRSSSSTPGEKRYRCLFENNLDAVFCLDRQGRFTEANAAAERLSGFSQQELRSMLFADLPVEQDRHKAKAFFARAIAGSPRSAEFAAVRRDGSSVELSVNGVPILVEGVVTGLFCLARDITRERHADAQLRRARRDAESAKDQFLAVVSHELRTPLMPVLTTLQMLERRADLPSELHDSLAMMRRNLELESRLIDDLLDLNRIREGKLTLDTRDMDLHAKIRNVVEICRLELAEKRLSLRLDLDAARSDVCGDPARIQQALWNVIGNAIKFTPEDGAISIRTCNGPKHRAEDQRRCSHSPSLECAQRQMVKGRACICVHVADNGVGIAPTSMPRIFDAFSRADQSHCGKGAGLAISKALMELHGGALLGHSSGQGKGSTFTLVLPICQGQCFEDSGRPVGQGLSATKGKRVLLVEDHRDTARALARLLTESGLKVQSAASVEAACAAIEASEFDLIISDIGLPDGNGIDVVRFAHRGRQVPAIALSGYGMEEDVRRSLDAGFAEHMVKPINISHLQATIKRLLADS